MPDRIALVEAGGRGGLAQYTWCLARALERAGTEVALLTARDYEWSDHLPVSVVHRVFRGRRTSPLGLWRSVRALVRLGYRTWHLQSASRPGSLALLVPVLRMAGVRHVLVTAHNAVPHNSGRLGRWLARLLYRQTDGLFAHGPSMVAEVARAAGLSLDAVVDVPHGDYEDLPLPKASEGKGNEILFFGYIHPAKGLDVLICAAGILHRRGLDPPLRIAGRLEEPWDRYRDLIAREGVTDVRLELDYVSAERVPGLFADAAVVVLPYLRASQSGVPRIAARYETPVVATRAGGMTDSLIHETNALLVDPGDVEGLADAVERVLTDRELARRLGRGLREHSRTGSTMEETARRSRAAYLRLHGARGAWIEAETTPARPLAPSALPGVSVIVPVRNESATIDACLDSILDQDYPADRFEILVADGRSTDDTRDRIRRRAGGRIPVHLVDNPGEIVSTGMNEALATARGEVVVRVDGHTRIALDYVRESVQLLIRSGAAGVGGPMRARGDTRFGRAVAAATSSRFGIGDSPFHYARTEVPVESVYLGVYWTRLLQRLGGYDEELVRNQDDELNARIRASGGTLILSPRLRSVYACRGSWRLLWRQYFQYGSWKVRSVRKTPAAFRLRHLAPALFVAGLAAGPPAGLLWAPLGAVFLGVLALYVASAVTVAGRNRRRTPGAAHLMPAVFVVLHLAYGLGTWHGLIRFHGGNRTATPSGRLARAA